MREKEKEKESERQIEHRDMPFVPLMVVLCYLKGVLQVSVDEVDEVCEVSSSVLQGERGENVLPSLPCPVSGGCFLVTNGHSFTGL